jgi:SAM-dependent methyltransferase
MNATFAARSARIAMVTGWSGTSRLYRDTRVVLVGAKVRGPAQLPRAFLVAAGANASDSSYHPRMSSPLATPGPWDLVSTAYAAEVTPAFEAFAADALRLAAPSPGSRVVDIACGPGTLAALAGRAGHAVDAIDFSPRMIELLRARALANVTAHVGDGQALPFADGAHGAAFSMFGLIFFPDRAKGLAEMRRVLAPGARAVVSSWQPADQVPALAAVFRTLREQLPQLPPPAEMPFGTVDACRTELETTFCDVEVHPIAHAWKFASSSALWDSLARTFAPVVLIRERVAPDAWRRLDDVLRAAVARAIGDGPAELPMAAWLSVGTA